MKIGLLVNNFTVGELAYEFISSANTTLKTRQDLDVYGFYENLNTLCLQPLFGIMQVQHCWDFNGVAVATSLSTVEKLLPMPGPERKLFYINDLEWTRLKVKDYLQLASLYRNQEIDIITTSDYYAKIITRAWNRIPLGIMSKFDINKLLELC